MNAKRLMIWSIATAAMVVGWQSDARAGDGEAAGADAAARVATFEAAAAAAPHDAAAQVVLSQAYAMAGREQDAFRAIQRAVELAPDNLAYHAARIPLANWAGKTEAAAESAERILAKSPNDRDATLALARVRKWQGRLDVSSRIYRRYVKAFTNDPAAVIEAAQVQAWKGDFPSALGLLDLYEERHGADATSQRERGRVLASANRPRAAIRILDGLTADPAKAFEETYTRALALYYGRQYREALDALKELDRLRPDNPEARDLRALMEAQRRTQVRIEGRYYEDSDDLSIARGGATAEWRLRPTTRVEVSAETVRLKAPVGSGLENVDGGATARARAYRAGVEQIVVPSLALDGQLGYAETDADNDFMVGLAGLRWRPDDTVTFRATADRDRVLISPRTVSADLTRKGGALEAVWEPDLNYTVVGAGRMEDFSDGNRRSEAILAPRRSVLRSRWLNADLGVRGWWLAFDQRLNTGYYSPESYDQYSGTLFAYVKLGPQAGLGLMGAAGYYQDETMNRYEFGWSVDGELTVGSFADWMLKVNGAVIENFRQQAGGAFNARAVGASLTRRF